MPHVLVCGGVHHDRIWRLDAPLVPGGRLRVRGKTMVLGGGAFHTARALLELGAEVALVSCLAGDALGQAARTALTEQGFDIRHIESVLGETVPLDILVDPDGERTILSPLRSGEAALRMGAPMPVDAAYLNTLHLDDSVLANLAQTPLVISQLPLHPATPRPADYVVTSRSDGGADMASIWTRAAALAGPRLKAVVLTDGPRPITLHDGVASLRIEAAPVCQVSSSIGAGDRFCGSLLAALLAGAPLAEAAATASRQTADWLARRPDADGCSAGVTSGDKLKFIRMNEGI